MVVDGYLSNSIMHILRDSFFAAVMITQLLQCQSSNLDINQNMSHESNEAWVNEPSLIHIMSWDWTGNEYHDVTKRFKRFCFLTCTSQVNERLLWACTAGILQCSSYTIANQIKEQNGGHANSLDIHVQSREEHIWLIEESLVRG